MYWRGEGALIALLMTVAAQLARIDDRSPWKWGAVAALFSCTSLVIPIPYLRILIAAVAVMVAMMATSPWFERDKRDGGSSR